MSGLNKVVADHGENPSADKWMELQKRQLDCYSFSCRSWQPKRLGYLIGNGEIGGLAKPDGLGFEPFHVASYWLTPVVRGELPGIFMELSEGLKSIADYHQTLSLEDGVLSTKVKTTEGSSYRSEIFVSQAIKNLFAMRLHNTSDHELTWRVHLPVTPNTDLRQTNARSVRGVNPKDDFTHYAWVALAEHSMEPTTETGVYAFALPPGAKSTVLFSIATSRESPEPEEKALNAIEAYQNFRYLLRMHRAEWYRLWSASPVIDIPDKRIEQLYYRSIYWLLSASASEYSLPSETPFAATGPSWGGIAFTYGYGWGLRALALTGHPDKARRMARLAFRPAALKRNAQRYLEQLKARNEEFFFVPSAAPLLDESIIPVRGPVEFLSADPISSLHGDQMSFGHQVSIYGDCRFRRGHQRHIDGFASANYHLLSSYYPNDTFTLSVTYPVLKGTAEFWSSLVEWNDAHQGYLTPPLHSVAENITAPSILDAVLAARWNLNMAADYAERFNLDPEARGKWRNIASTLVIPQNEHIYLETLESDGSREGGGYFGVRAPCYLGYPFGESIVHLDTQKALRTLDSVFVANLQNDGMISFVASSFAATEAAFGRGNEWLRFINRNFECLDPDTGALSEVTDLRPYFHTSYGAFICAVTAALIDSREGKLHTFPAVPSDWTRVAFHNLPVENGNRVSAEYSNGKLQWSKITDGKLPHDDKATSCTG